MSRLALALFALACATVPAHNRLSELVDEESDAYNAQDLNRFARTYADDVVVTVGPQRVVRVEGKAALKEWYGAMFARYPNCRSTIVGRRPEGDRAISVHEIITGRGPERPDPWDAGWVRFDFDEKGLIRRVEIE